MSTALGSRGSGLGVLGWLLLTSCLVLAAVLAVQLIAPPPDVAAASAPPPATASTEAPWRPRLLPQRWRSSQ